MIPLTADAPMGPLPVEATGIAVLLISILFAVAWLAYLYR